MCFKLTTNANTNNSQSNKNHYSRSEGTIQPLLAMIYERSDPSPQGEAHECASLSFSAFSQSHASLNLAELLFEYQIYEEHQFCVSPVIIGSSYRNDHNKRFYKLSI